MANHNKKQTGQRLSVHDRCEQFIKQATNVHNGKYDYSLINYKNMQSKVTIICPIHGEFDQAPMSHVNGTGCSKCAVLTRQNTLLAKTGFKHALQNEPSKNKQEQTMIARYGVSFASQSDIVRDKISNTLFQNYGVSNSPFESTVIRQRARDSMKDRHGVEFTLQSDTLREKVTTTIKTRYGVDNSTRRNIPHHIISYYTDYDWLFDQYVNQNKTANQIASDLNINSTTILRYLHQFNIPIKQQYLYSYKSIQWIEYTMIQDNINIQHALNGGEYQIPGTRYRADGYCKETNTIYEFHGDRFHGNPTVFAPDDVCHPFDTSITANELYNNTIIKEQTIVDMGFNLVVKWEHDYDTEIQQCKLEME